MALPDLSQYNSLLRTLGVFGSGIAVSVGVISSVDVANATAALQDIGDGVKLIMKGGGVLIPIGLGAWGFVKAGLKSKVADVKVAAPADLAHAVAQVQPAQLVAAVSAMPEVKQITTSSPTLANAARQGDPATVVNMVPAHA